ncbi:hypothetical protein NDU88_003787 [Pleurodeles waltl]|uniref:Uncharacterized protein n=1 Tax=Pleurodeles waltl TaxID=8319 RepID=A0AAV7PB10_PLEWA|nr:hypothetical protein NDU88_003787 [Pleurodeles waltl]
MWALRLNPFSITKQLIFIKVTFVLHPKTMQRLRCRTVPSRGKPATSLHGQSRCIQLRNLLHVCQFPKETPCSAHLVYAAVPLHRPV